MSDFTPTTDDVRAWYAAGVNYLDGTDRWLAEFERQIRVDEAYAEFDRWLAEFERQIREQIAQDIENAEQQMKASTIDRPKVGPGEFLNDWQWAARIARGVRRDSADRMARGER